MPTSIIRQSKTYKFNSYDKKHILQCLTILSYNGRFSPAFEILLLISSTILKLSSLRVDIPCKVSVPLPKRVISHVVVKRRVLLSPSFFLLLYHIEQVEFCFGSWGCLPALLFFRITSSVCTENGIRGGLNTSTPLRQTAHILTEFGFEVDAVKPPNLGATRMQRTLSNKVAFLNVLEKLTGLNHGLLVRMA